ncbi:hypothetical protein [Sphingobium fuliginis]|jgi:hypothetical protein|uniref:hypothetical protein n=1 Tax=Sphingobium fuliginis (strain ATCC 27551) TaxID=336203 RepID=UPI0037C7EB02
MAGWAGNDPAPIPQWATNRAQQELGGALTPDQFLRAFARYIAQHEQPSVDPDVIAVREIVGAACRNNGLSIAGELKADSPAEIAAVIAYRKHKEEGE